ncbi:MAG: peptidoglycan DD-metalloendopeptidase family protein [Ktedonobacterales bacterium]
MANGARARLQPLAGPRSIVHHRVQWRNGTRCRVGKNGKKKTSNQRFDTVEAYGAAPSAADGGWGGEGAWDDASDEAADDQALATVPTANPAANPYETRRITAIGAIGAISSILDQDSTAEQRAIITADTVGRGLPAFADDEEADTSPAVFIPGTGVAKAHPFIKRRERPLTLRVALVTLIGAIVLTGVFAVSPLIGVAPAAANSIQAISGAVALRGVAYFWYTAQWGDTEQIVAQKFHAQMGGIYELNNLYAGEELTIGQQYKVPQDGGYGKSYNPPSLLDVAAHYGDKRFGPNWWNSIAGNAPGESPCAPNGGTNYMGYQLHSPNWNARWVRGYIVIGTWVYHTGVDLAAPQGNVIHAAQAGQVVWAGYDATNGLGWSVKIDHCNHVSTVYGHMLKLLVHTGQYIYDAGTPIGLEGSTGNSTGPHLHFMVEWNNLWVDPMRFYANQYTISHNV